ncbi:transcription enhancer protein, putative, partial [Entamoeba invadens IP1]
MRGLGKRTTNFKIQKKMSSRSEALDLSQTFEKMKNPDPDLRYMATSDLNVSLGKMKGKKFIDNEQREIMSGLLTLLTDEANDVKDITIKCLSSFMPFVTSVSAVKSLVEKLKTMLLDAKKALDVNRDVALEVIKRTIKIIVINKEFKLVLTDNFSVPLLNFFKTPLAELSDISIGFNLDVLEVIIRQIGATLDVSRVVKTLTPFLSEGVFANRRRTVQCLAQLSKYANDTQMEEIIVPSFEAMKKSTNKEQSKVYVLLYSTIASVSKEKCGKYLTTCFELLRVKFTAVEDDSEDDLKEAILNAFNLFIVNCPNQLSNEVAKEILKYVVQFLQYDPNRFDDDEEEDDANAMEEEEDDEEVFEDEDDITWKLRKLSGDCLVSLVKERSDMFCEVVSEALSVVLKRFKESVEIVLNIVLGVYSLVLKTVNSGVCQCVEKVRESVSGAIPQIESILKGKKSTEKSKMECFNIVKEIAVFDGAALVPHVNTLEGVIVTLLNSANSHVELLSTMCECLRNIVKINGVDSFSAAISPVLVSLFDSKNFRVEIEVLKTESVLLRYAKSAEMYTTLNVGSVKAALVT